MNDHNLDDLIIDTDTPKQSKAKGFLTIIALFIVVLIVAIILTKIILKDSDTAKPALVEENTEMISPELTLQSATEDQEEKEPALSEMIKDEMEAPQEHVSHNESSSQTHNPPAQEETILIDEEKGKVAIAAPKQPSVQKEETSAATAESKKHTVSPKPAAKKPATHKTATPQPKTTQHSTTVYYIQVGSFSKTPVNSSRLVAAIKKNGYRYSVYPSHGMKKVLIGPYKSRAEADRAIVRIKDRINKNAFVFTK